MILGLSEIFAVNIVKKMLYIQPGWPLSYLGIVALAKVQHRSIHITDIQQNIDIPVEMTFCEKGTRITPETHIQKFKIL